MNSQFHHELGAAFFVIGGDIHPSEFTSHFGVEPHYSKVKGEPRLDSNGVRIGVHQETVWGFSSPAMPDEPEVETHIAHILNVIEPHANFLLGVAEKSVLHMELRCSLDDRFKSTSFLISHSIVSRLEMLKVEIGVLFRVENNECPRRTTA